MSSRYRVCFYLFVYGSLRSRFQNPHAQLLARSADLLGNGRVRGHRYQLKRYPGILLEPQAKEWVEGEVYRLRNLGVLAKLDGYEGSEFQRVRAPVVRRNGSRTWCWIYALKRVGAARP